MPLHGCLQSRLPAVRHDAQRRIKGIEFEEVAVRPGGRAWTAIGALPEAGLRLIVDEAKKTVKIEREIPLNEIADLSILREAQKELGIRPK